MSPDLLDENKHLNYFTLLTEQHTVLETFLRLLGSVRSPFAWYTTLSPLLIIPSPYSFRNLSATSEFCLFSFLHGIDQPPCHLCSWHPPLLPHFALPLKRFFWGFSRPISLPYA